MQMKDDNTALRSIHTRADSTLEFINAEMGIFYLSVEI